MDASSGQPWSSSIEIVPLGSFRRKTQGFRPRSWGEATFIAFDRNALYRRCRGSLERQTSNSSCSPALEHPWTFLIARLLRTDGDTHPALLPSFKGWHAVRDALFSRSRSHRMHCAHRHRLSRRGPILAFQEVKIEPTDTRIPCTSASNRSNGRIYPDAIKDLISEIEGCAAMKG